MKSKLDFKSKRTIIIASIIAVLAIGAGIGGYFYAKGNNKSGAIDTPETSAQTPAENPTTNPENQERNKNSESKNNTNNGENNNANTNNQENNSNTNNNENANNNNGENVNNNNNTRNGVAVNNNDGNNGNNNVENAGDDTDATTVIENITVEDPWETHSVKWTPETIEVSTPSVEVEKFANIVGEKSNTIDADKDGKKIVKPGDTFTYIIKLTNYGNIKGTTTLTDEVPAGLKVLETSLDASVDEENPNKLTWKNISLKAGEIKKIKIDVEVLASVEGTIENTATVGENKTNTDTTDTLNYDIVKEVISKDADEDGKYNTDEVIEYKVTVTNKGSIVATQINVTDENADKVEGEKVATRTIDSLAPGESKSVTFTHKVTEDDIKAGSVVNVATVDRTDSNTVVTETEEINKTIEVKKETTSKPANEEFYVEGETIKYKVTVTNKGNIAQKVTVSDPNADEEDQEIELAKQGDEGDSKEIEFTHKVTAEDVEAKKVTNVATGKVEGEDPTPSDPVEEKTDKEDKTIEVKKETTSKPANKEFYVEGETIKYKVTVTNKGNIEQTITVSDPNADEEDKVVTLAKAGTEGKDSKTIEFTHKVTAKDVEAKKVTNVATGKVEGEDPTPSDPVVEKTDKEDKTIEVKKETTSKPANKEFYVEGETIKYKVTVTNKGNIAQTVTVSDPNADEEDQEVELAKQGDKGDSKEIEFTHKVTAEDVEAKKVTNVATGKVEGEDPTSSNTVEDKTGKNNVDIQVTKTWNDKGYIDTEKDRPESITVNLLANGKVAKDANGKAITATIKADKNGNWTYTFKNLDKYDSDGKEIEYTVSEDDIKTKIVNAEGKETEVTLYTPDITGNAENGFNIKNNYNNITVHKLTPNGVEQSDPETKPIDMVFVLDVSTSMVNNNSTKGKDMVDAVNSAISTILNTKTSSKSRIGIVFFWGSAKVGLTLDTYDSINLTYNSSGYKSITTTYKKAGSSTTQTDTTYFNSATYTQAGIALGGELLANASKADEMEYRTPVLVLLTDGAPTGATTHYDSVITDYSNGTGYLRTTNVDCGNTEDAEVAYYTIKSAVSYKQKINDATTSSGEDLYERPAKFYTIGFGLSGIYSETILNPTQTNINRCETGYTYKDSNGRTVTVNPTTESKKLKSDYLGSNPTSYAYADGSYVGSMTASELTSIFETITAETKLYDKKTYTTSLSEKITKINLENLDIKEDITISVDGNETKKKYNQIPAVKKDSNGEYYIDLTDSMFEDAKYIEITYYEEKIEGSKRTKNFGEAEYPETKEETTEKKEETKNEQTKIQSDAKLKEKANTVESKKTEEKDVTETEEKEVESDKEEKTENKDKKETDDKSEKEEVSSDKTSEQISNNDKNTIKETETSSKAENKDSKNETDSKKDTTETEKENSVVSEKTEEISNTKE